MVWSCAHCTYENDDVLSTCNICHIKRADLNEVNCPVCTLLNHREARECTACGFVLSKRTAANTVDVSSDSDSEDDVAFFDSIKRLFDNFVDTVQTDGQVRFLCRYDGRECLSRDMMCAYLSRFHADKIRSHIKIQQNSALGDENGSDRGKGSTPPYSGILLPSTTADDDASYALSLALAEYDEHMSRSSKSAPGSPHHPGELEHQQSILRSYSTGCGLSGSSVKRKSGHNTARMDYTTRPQSLRQRTSTAHRMRQIASGSTSPSCALHSLGSYPYPSKDHTDSLSTNSSASTILSTAATGGVYPISILRDNETKAWTISRANEIARKSALVTGDALSQEDKETRLLKLLQKSDQIVRRLASVMPTPLQQLPNPEGSLFTQVLHSSGGDSNEISQQLGSVSQPAAIAGCQLRAYQLKGMEWLCGIHASGLNGILADEMGLGKTLQVLAFMCCLRERFAIRGPHLLVMPLSVIASWRGDVASYCADDIKCHVHLGTREEREENFDMWIRQIKQSMGTSSSDSGRARNVIHVCLTTYDMVLRDSQLLGTSMRRRSLQWSYIVVDEAHRLKNSQAKLFSTLISLKGRRHLLLTGTPLQNNLKELWSLLHFILPEVFFDFSEFSDWFNRPFDSIDSNSTTGISRRRKRQKGVGHGATQSVTDEEKAIIVGSLHRVLKPFILRRVKEDVALDLPLKVEKVLLCPLSCLQTELHTRLITAAIDKDAVSSRGWTDSSELDRLLQDGGDRSRQQRNDLSSANLLMQLRKVCNHPYLVLESIKCIPDDLYFEHLVPTSGKLLLLSQLLDALIPLGHKFTTMLDILQGFLQTKGYGCHRLDGSTDRHTREKLISEFREKETQVAGRDSTNSSGVDDSNGQACPVFLLSTRAGGVGINLQTADTVILFDSDWNPQMDLQAIGRAHRIGQQKEVLVLRLISATNCAIRDAVPTVEEKIAQRASKKLLAERTVLAKGKFDIAAAETATWSLNSLSSAATASKEPRAPSPSLPCGGSPGDNNALLCEEVIDLTALETTALNDEMVSYICRRTSCLPQQMPPPVVSASVGAEDPMLSSKGLDVWTDWLFSDEPSVLVRSDSHDTEGDLSSGLPSGRTRMVRKRPSSSLALKSLNEDQAWREMVNKKEKDRERSSRAQETPKKKQTGTVTIMTEKKADDIFEESDDDICELCGEDYIEHSTSSGSCSGKGAKETSSASTLLICDGCDMTFHLFCLGLDDIPEGDWYCELCCRSFGICSYGHSALAQVTQRTHRG